ncbi:S53 family peptidase [Arthrobacter russicus]|uniref:Kumamolisin n=1 Tax=Arthrobacter russicus TaxID=172040 RepID=A0ABU1JAX2_9MICC|nr:S53 family serine peptidase [Arthrobacter russicus]MDR6269573.1 kumamolisin [Arthrobacter russicus]
MKKIGARTRSSVVAGLAVPALVLAFTGTAVAAIPASPDSVQGIAGSTSPRLGHAQRLDSAPAQQQRKITVSLAPHNAAGLDAFLANVNDPASPQYRHFLTSAEYAARFAPTPAEVSAVSSALTAKGLSVDRVGAGNRYVSASGSVAQLQDLFKTSLSQYRDSVTGADFTGADSEVKVPQALAGLITDVGGLTDEGKILRPASRQAPAAPEADAAKQAPSAVGAKGATDQGTGVKGGFTPKELNSGYNTASIANGAQGAGQTIALVEFSGHRSSHADVYDQQYNLATSAVQDINVDDGPQGYDEGEGEVDLDIQVLHAIAPKATVLDYQAPNTDSADIDLYNQIVTDNKASIISSSWGNPENQITKSHATSLSNIFKQAAAQGQTIFSASGDHGASDDWPNNSDSALTVDSPSSDPNVTGVGGTRLYIDSSTGAWSSEAVWNDYVKSGDTWRGASGGGVSTFFARPTWQTGTGVNTSQKRQVPDISSAAAEYQYSGYTEVYDGNGKDTNKAAWTSFTGTSAAAPLNAAFLALVANQGGGSVQFGNLNPAIYKAAANNPSAFHDVTSGSNSIVGKPSSYAVTAGYDKATGWGSPNFPAYGTEILKK